MGKRPLSCFLVQFFSFFFLFQSRDQGLGCQAEGCLRGLRHGRFWCVACARSLKSEWLPPGISLRGPANAANGRCSVYCAL